MPDVRGDPYRPLVSGVRIVNEITGIPGTLGCIGVDVAGNTWIVSADHVLGRPRQSPDVAGNDEPIFQSTLALGGGIVARTRTGKMNRALDFAAAIIVPNIDVSPSVLELVDPLQRTADAVVGMRVVKSGAETGVTIGIVSEMTDSLITIVSPPIVPDDYVLSDRGDSGAIWLDAATGRAIGMHFSGRNGDTAYARPLAVVLGALELRLLG